MKRILGRALRGVLPHRSRHYWNLFFRRLDERTLGKFLSELGVTEGETLYVQSSVGSLGYFPGGANRLVELLLRLLGPGGTLVVPSFPFRGTMESFVAQGPVYDVRHTPSRIGALPEAVRSRRDARRSIHPSHPVCAVGRWADELTEGHERCPTPQGEGSPFAKLVEARARILRIGARSYPLIHHLQERLEFPNLFLPEPAVMKCVDREGRMIAVTARVYRSRVPYTLYMDGAEEGHPVAMNITDFPVLFGERRGRELEQDARKVIPVSHMITLRSRLAAEGALRAGVVNGCEVDVCDIVRSMALGLEEGRRLLDRYADRYDPARMGQDLVGA